MRKRKSTTPFLIRVLSEATTEALKEFVIESMALGSPEMLDLAIRKNISFTKVLRMLKELAKRDNYYGTILVMLVNGLEIGRKVMQHYPPSKVDPYFKVDKVMEFLKNERPDYYKVIMNHGDKGLKWVQARLNELKRWLYT